MSRFQKLCLASLLVAVGFGVAKFLGQPLLPTQPHDADGAQIPAATVFDRDVATTPLRSSHTGGDRLLPDGSSNIARTPPAGAFTALEPPALGKSIVPVITASDAATDMPQAVEGIPVTSSPSQGINQPRATLRDEAPRAIGVDPQSPVAIRRMPPVDTPNPDNVVAAQNESPAWPAPPLLNSSGANATPPPPPVAIPASYHAAATSSPSNQIAPPSWPTQEDREPCTHVIVDGDSLERIAARYLSDPSRSREIYELNRDVLSSPDLLPIGAELKIPERTTSASFDCQRSQVNSASVLSNREMVRDNSAPVRPLSSPERIIPRAQLAVPVMVQ
ncbi:MAG TPA: LysM domain-containing protein [Lacipirellulaceae bacterium]|nr:LysM domain-containing protein [Lacipirellulaceae bacterium]